MFKEDKDFLKNLLADYDPKLVMRALAEAAQEAADEASDDGLSDDAKQLSLMAQALEDITSGRPYLV